LFYWWHTLSEEINTEFLELSAWNTGAVIFTISKGFALNFSLMSRWENTLCFFALCAKTSHSTSITVDVNARLFLEVSNTVVNKSVIKIFTTQVSITISGFDFENTVFDGQKRNIKSTTTKIKNENISFAFTFLVKSVSDGSCSWLIDNTLNVKTWDCSSIFGSLSLRVIEIGWDSDDSILDSLAKVSFSDFFHLEKNHWWDFFSLEFLGFTLELDNNQWLFCGAWFDFEWP